MMTPQVRSAELLIPPPLATSVSVDLADIDTIALPLEFPRVNTLGCQYVPAVRGARTQSSPPVATNHNPYQGHVTPPAVRRTRIRPPQDVVRLADRLRYLLAPPLEAQLALNGLSFAHEPFAYQLDGIAFLYPQHHAVLADEMGLGKTMQAISAVRLLVHRDQLRRVLLVCPKPLITNWQREFALWAPEIPVTVVDGPSARRQFLWRQREALVAITNYESIVRDQQEIATAGRFDLVILDEAQRIKNRRGATSQAVRAIERQRSWALTGTPIENSLDDLVGIGEFAMPGRLRPEMRPQSVRRAVSDILLRRTKDRVLADMPPKLFRDAHVELTADQRESYQLAEEEGIVRLAEMTDGLSIQHVFELIVRLKQICNFDPATGTSSKFERLEADLEECASSGHKALVFSQWVETLEQLRGRLARFGPLAYHGSIQPRQRERVIEQFRQDEDAHVLLMSYGAGGVGLNLQFASYVFLFDRWWNPAVEDQAVNRAHRIGAAGPVTVTRFLTIGTIEERIDEILQSKRELFDSIFGGDLATASCGLSREEVFSLFDLPTRSRRAA